MPMALFQSTARYRSDDFMDPDPEDDTFMWLESMDKGCYRVERSRVKGSHLIQMLAEDAKPNQIIHLKNITSALLYKVLIWLNHHKDADGAEKMKFTFWHLAFFDMEARDLYDLKKAGQYMHVKTLVYASDTLLSYIMKGKTPLEVRIILNLPREGTRNEERAATRAVKKELKKQKKEEKKAKEKALEAKTVGPRKRRPRRG